MTCDFCSEDAVRYGLDEAVMLNHLRVLTDSGKLDCMPDSEGLVRMFPFWSINQVNDIMASLYKEGAIDRLKE